MSVIDPVIQLLNGGVQLTWGLNNGDTGTPVDVSGWPVRYWQASAASPDVVMRSRLVGSGAAVSNISQGLIGAPYTEVYPEANVNGVTVALLLRA